MPLSQEKNMVTLTIDGNSIQVPEGTLVIEAARQAGVMIPHFCYHPKLEPDANCRMCLVEIEKVSKLQTSCSTRVAEGMVVHSSATHVEAARKSILELLLVNHPLDCPVCDQGGRCDLQDFSHEYTPTASRFTELKRVFPKEYLGPLIETQMNRCVSCMRCVRYCDEVMDAHALAAEGRGTMTKITHWSGHELTCDYCGGCIQICPVGAITSRLSMYDYRPWMLKRTETICGYCGDGCQITVQTKDQELIEVNSTLGAGRNNGDLCVRGYFGYHASAHPDRLQHPLIRQADGTFLQATWEEALTYIAEKFSQIKSTFGPDAISGLITARCTNEDLYVFQKFMRVVIGTNQIDSSSRYGYINGINALWRVQGTHRWTVNFEDIVEADGLLLIGTNITATNPITGLKVKEAVKKRGASLITLESLLPIRETVSNITTLSKHHLTILPGEFDMAVLGMIKATVEQDLVDERVAETSSEFVQSVKSNIEKIQWDLIQDRLGLDKKSFEDSVKTFKQAKRAITVVGQGVLHALDGAMIVTNLLDLLILTGHHGREGSGLVFLAEENNEQGALEMGVVTEYLPGPGEKNDDKVRNRLAKVWGHVLPSGSPATLIEQLGYAKDGTIKAMFIVGENPVETLPPEVQAADSLEALEFLVCQELFLTETAKRANVILPASSSYEKDGTFTNQEGHVQPVRKSIEPIGESQPDWEIFSALSVFMKNPVEYKDNKEILKEIFAVIPGYGLLGLSSARPPVRENFIQHYLQNGYKEDVDLRYAVKRKQKSANDEMALVLVQNLFHSGKYSTRAKGLMEMQDCGFLSMNPRDAKRLGLEDGDTAHVSNDQGDVSVVVKFAERVPIGTVWFPEHFAQSILPLFKVKLDSITKVPSWKIATVRIFCEG